MFNLWKNNEVVAASPACSTTLPTTSISVCIYERSSCVPYYKTAAHMFLSIYVFYWWSLSVTLSLSEKVVAATAMTDAYHTAIGKRLVQENYT